MYGILKTSVEQGGIAFRFKWDNKGSRLWFSDLTTIIYFFRRSALIAYALPEKLQR